MQIMMDINNGLVFVAETDILRSLVGQFQFANQIVNDVGVLSFSLFQQSHEIDSNAILYTLEKGYIVIDPSSGYLATKDFAASSSFISKQAVNSR